MEYLEQYPDGKCALKLLIDAGCKKTDLLDLLFLIGYRKYTLAAFYGDLFAHYSRLVSGTENKDFIRIAREELESVKSLRSFAAGFPMMLEVAETPLQREDPRNKRNNERNLGNGPSYIELPEVTEFLYLSELEEIETSLKKIISLVGGLQSKLDRYALDVSVPTFLLYIRLATTSPQARTRKVQCHYDHAAALIHSVGSGFGFKQLRDVESATIGRQFRRFKENYPRKYDILSELIAYYCDEYSGTDSLAIWLPPKYSAALHSEVPLQKGAVALHPARGDQDKVA